MSERVTNLIRKSYGGSLVTSWILDDKDYNASKSSDLNINLIASDPPTLLSWSVLFPLDVGGTLHIDNKLKSV